MKPVIDDAYVDGLIDGSITCDTCPALNELLEQVRSGELSKLEFKELLLKNVT